VVVAVPVLLSHSVDGCQQRQYTAGDEIERLLALLQACNRHKHKHTQFMFSDCIVIAMRCDRTQTLNVNERKMRLPQSDIHLVMTV
jgi:hypothetical protein